MIRRVSRCSLWVGIGVHIAVAPLLSSGWDAALRCYSHGIEESEASGSVPPPLVDDNVKLRANRSLVHLEIGQYERALDDARKAVAVAPGWISLEIVLASTYLELLENFRVKNFRVTGTYPGSE